VRACGVVGGGVTVAEENNVDPLGLRPVVDHGNNALCIRRGKQETGRGNDAESASCDVFHLRFLNSFIEDRSTLRRRARGRARSAHLACVRSVSVDESSGTARHTP
ncbi:MAG: hypothetical protein QGH94_05240, partial [Phycisphaerae bacterium]|nr:hypothetical protein [Phycisphaerae bacterium]